MPIRIAVVGLPVMLRQIISTLLNKEDDFRVIRPPEEQADLVALVESTKTDVIILGNAGREAPAAADRLLKEYPGLKLFTITPNGRDAFRVELKPKTFPIEEISTRRLVDEIRHALARVPPGNPAEGRL